VYGNVLLSGTGTKSLPAGTVRLTGDWTNNSTLSVSTSSVVSFQGTGLQTLGGSSSTSFASLTIAKSSGQVDLAQNTSVTLALALNQGIVNAGSRTVQSSA
jgi:hypothetical protein